MTTLELIAPAKLNLTLEILGKRDDGYHEIASIMQTIDLADTVRLSPAGGIELVVSGEAASGVPEDPARNLAYRAAVALAAEAGRSDLGARIELVKRIPAGMGLGGGSSDAAAVLRGLNRLWSLGYETSRLAGIAAGLGSDVSFFLHGGTALATGRGEVIEPLSDDAGSDLTVFLPNVEVEDKTRKMYALVAPDDYTTGDDTLTYADMLREGGAMFGRFECRNTFDRHVATLAPHVGKIISRCRQVGLDVQVTGSGPAFFTRKPPYEVPRGLYLDLGAAGITVVGCRTLTRAEATAVIEV